MASQQSTGGGTASALTTDDDVTIVAAGTSLGRSTRRTRFSQTAQEIGKEFFNPLQTAQKHIKSTTSTHLPGMQTIYSEKGLKHLALAHKFLPKQRNITRMEDDVDYVPVSARVSFKVQTWKEAEDSTEYTALVMETNALITTFQLQLKEQIIKNEWSTVWSTTCTHLYQTKMTLKLEPSPPFATSSDADTNHKIYILYSQAPSQDQ
jgi:hypothetical protein